MFFSKGSTPKLLISSFFYVINFYYVLDLLNDLFFLDTVSSNFVIAGSIDSLLAWKNTTSCVNCLGNISWGNGSDEIRQILEDWVSFGDVIDLLVLNGVELLLFFVGFFIFLVDLLGLLIGTHFSDSNSNCWNVVINNRTIIMSLLLLICLNLHYLFFNQSKLSLKQLLNINL
mgnify:FL=1